jgi:DNA mismatch repair protein PMS2
MVLELPVATECVIIEHMSTFERNGFVIRIDEAAAPGRQLRLVAVPFSQNRQFGVSDVHELAALCADAAPAGGAELGFGSAGGSVGLATIQTLRLPRVMAMFASRACRSAIMIGTALDRAQMTRVVQHLAEIEQPWNCPHGRPTMRHVADLVAIRQIIDRAANQ